MPKQPATLGAALVDRDLARHFAQRAATYDLAPWVRDPRIMATTIDFIDPRPGQKIVDVGAGTGAVLEAVLAARPDVGECVAVDISPEMLARIRNRRIRSCKGDAQELPWHDAAFDAAICRQTLHYVDDLDRCLAQIRRVLRPEGVLVIGQMTPFSDEDETYWEAIVRLRQPLRRHDLTAGELTSLVHRNGFRIVRTTQTRARESLNSWLARYEDTDRQLAELRRLHLEAPKAYQRIHNFERRGDDILLDNCWTFLRATVKPGPAASGTR